MALERDLELMDDYLSNRLDGKEKEAFEERLKNDSNLSDEFKTQQSLVQGIQQARVAELKSMLNSIPVTTVPPSQTALLTKIGSWALVTGLVATATYFYVTRDESSHAQQEQTEQEKIVEPLQEEQTPVKSEESIEVQPESSEIKTESVAKPKEKSKEIAVKPAIQAYDPTTEEAEANQKYEKEQLSIISNAFVTSSMEVETLTNDKKYNFHYVFKDEKLVLYGSFEKNLYEILEFISEDDKTVVLYYKTNYYLLDVAKSVPTVLTPIRNRELLRKLKEHRGK
jgi:hypothetical protein